MVYYPNGPGACPPGGVQPPADHPPWPPSGFQSSFLQRVLHGTLASHGGALVPGLLERCISHPAAQSGQGVIVGRRRRRVGQQPAGARGLQQRIRGGQQADGAVGIVPLAGQGRQPLQVVADA